jgi:acyl-coenzyme A synthetase/AMP-(fatty) acid ligase
VNPKKFRAELAADQELGTGNVLPTLMSHGVGLDDPSLTFDTDVETGTGSHPAWQPMTLRQLDRQVAARAAWLHGRGVRPRDPVALYLTDAADQVLSFLALFRIGAIPAPINRNVPGPIAATYVERLRPTALILDAAHRVALGERLPDVGAVIDVRETAAGGPDRAPVQFHYHPEDAAVVTHSSGTTGAPKAVLASHASLFASIRHRLTLPRAQGVDRMLSAMPANHAAMVILVNLALCNRSELLVLSDQSGTAVLAAAERWRPTSVLGFASTWAEIAAADRSGYDLDSVQMWWNTGDCAHETHIRPLVALGSRKAATATGIRQVPGSVFIDGLGSSEMGHSQFFITHTSDTDRYGRCIGKPHAFADIAVLDPAGNKLPPGAVGQLGVRSPTLFVGYWNDSVTTARTRLRGYFLTGDLVYRDEAGYYYHVDRAVDSIDLGDGTWLHTAQTEEVILAGCPEVLDCTVVAVREPDGWVSSTVLLMLAPDADPSVDRTNTVLALLPDHVADTVRDVVVVDESDIPHGPTGKVRKVLLRERFTALRKRAIPAAAEERLATS